MSLVATQIEENGGESKDATELINKYIDLYFEGNLTESFPNKLEEKHQFDFIYFLFYFILFYFILFYFILFYFILFKNKLYFNSITAISDIKVFVNRYNESITTGNF